MNDPADWRAIGVAELRALATALLRYASPGYARFRPAPPRTLYPAVWEELQGYARPLWGLAALAQSGQGDLVGQDIWEAWRLGLIHGTDPAHPEYWGQTEDHAQAFCEMAPIALALLWAKEKLWQPLSEAQRQHIIAWLNQINSRQLHANNWLWFRVLVNAVFFRLGQPYDEKHLVEDRCALEKMAGDDGWYVDGLAPSKRTADLYIPAAFHVYGLIAAELLEPLWPEVAQAWRERAVRFAQSWRWFQAEDGAPLSWGRSLSYRSCSAAFWAVCAWADLATRPWSEIAGLWRRQMAWWRSHPTLREDGCLSLGFAYPNEAICENYLALTSLYWQTKAWLALRRPAEHPFWSAPATALPSGPASWPLPTCGGLLLPHPVHPTLLLVGQYGNPWLDPDGARYGRFAYGTHHGFHIDPGTPWPDNALLLRQPGSLSWATRLQPDSWTVEANACSVTWTPLEGVRITSTLRPLPERLPGGHRREHHLSTRHPLEVIEGGWPCPPGSISRSPHHISLEGGGLRSTLAVEDTRKVGVLEPPEATNILHPRAVLPVASAILPPGEHTLITTVHA